MEFNANSRAVDQMENSIFYGEQYRDKANGDIMPIKNRLYTIEDLPKYRFARFGDANPKNIGFGEIEWLYVMAMMRGLHHGLESIPYLKTADYNVFLNVNFVGDDRRAHLFSYVSYKERLRTIHKKVNSCVIPKMTIQNAINCLAVIERNGFEIHYVKKQIPE
ncbi:hypothetical protein FACS189447_09580 [Spirochaetia bacterium]|nr:hypothetical protein FACS189447_09580 [Spirochaetia bacterium]